MELGRDRQKLWGLKRSRRWRADEASGQLREASAVWSKLLTTPATQSSYFRIYAGYENYHDKQYRTNNFLPPDPYLYLDLH